MLKNVFNPVSGSPLSFLNFIGNFLGANDGLTLSAAPSNSPNEPGVS